MSETAYTIQVYIAKDPRIIGKFLCWFSEALKSSDFKYQNNKLRMTRIEVSVSNNNEVL